MHFNEINLVALPYSPRASLLSFSGTNTTGADYSAVSTSANDVWNKLPPHAQNRFSAIIKTFWRKFVKPGQDCGVPLAALG